MSNLAFILITILSFTSCSSLTQNKERLSQLYTKDNIDEPVVPYLEDFLLALESSGQIESFKPALKTLTIRLVPGISTNQDPELNSSSGFYDRGRCFFKSNTIELDLAFFSWNTEDQRQFVVDHELGHCLLRRIHRRKVKDYKLTSVSTMTPIMINERDYNSLKKTYRIELLDDSRFNTIDILTKVIESQYLNIHRIDGWVLQQFEDQLNGDEQMSSDLLSFVRKNKLNLPSSVIQSP